MEHLSLNTPTSSSSTAGGTIYFLTIFSIFAHFIFRRYEPSGFEYLYIQLGSIILLRTLLPIGFLEIISIITLANLILIIQIIIYRSLWHDLRNVPGPRWAAISQIWITREAYLGRMRFTMKNLFDRYGEWVRIGPNELYTCNLEAIEIILGPKGWPKGTAYDSGITKGEGGGDSLLTIKTLSEHATRRRIWEKAFTRRAILGYVTSIETRIEELLQVFENHIKESKEVNLSLQIGYLVYDTMCDMAFGATCGTNLLKTQEDPHKILFHMGRVVRQVGILRNLPWLTPILIAWPSSQRQEQESFKKFTKEMFMKRWKKGLHQRKDVFHYLLGEDTETGTRLSVSELAADSTLAVITGADTTRTVLIALFLYLLRSPERMNRLQNEINSTPDLSPTNLARLTYLNACLQEAMRLQPPSPSNIQRVCPSGGTMIDGKFIPEGTKVRFSIYALQRNQEYFEDPNEFKPERWLKDREEEEKLGRRRKLMEKAFLAFLIGPGSCVAKNLAWMEMRMIVASILSLYDLSFGTGFDPDAFERSWTDAYLLLIQEPFMVRFTPKQTQLPS